MTAPGGTIVTPDTFTYGLSNGSGSWSHTVGSGSNRAILVFAFNFSALSGATFNGTAMTELASVLYSGSWPYKVYGLLNPASGAGSCSISNSGTYAASISYSGVGSFGAASNSTPCVVSSALGDAAVMSATSLDTGFANRGTWVLSHVIEEGWGTSSVSGAHGVVGVNLAAAGGGSPPANTTNFFRLL